MRRPFIAGNWKMNLNIEEATTLASALAHQTASFRNVDIAIAPTHLALSSVINAVKNTGIHVASQNHYFEESGAYTGQVSPTMLRAAGVAYALVGHSERRTLFNESLADVNKKMQAAFQAGLLPILCVGETLAERNQNSAESVIKEQIETALDGLSADQVAAVTIAYEPVWAIGTGITASPRDAQQIHAFIRKLLVDRYPAFVAEDVRIQYGGSVKPHNAAELLAQPDIDGALVGGASLTVDAFVGILHAITETQG